MKTVNRVQERPWVLTKAADYIDRLVQNNTAGDAPEWQLPSMDWVFNKMIGLSRAPAPEPRVRDEDSAFMHRTPAPVLVKCRGAGKRARVPPAADDELPGAMAVPNAIVAFRGAPDALREPGAPAGSGVPPQPRVAKRPAGHLDGDRIRARLGPLPEQWQGKLGCSKCTQTPDGCGR